MPTYDQSSRYFRCDNENELPQCHLYKSNYDYTETTVTAEENGRLDLVSYRVYNTPLNWWIIARFNAIINPLNISTGDILRIPKL